MADRGFMIKWYVVSQKELMVEQSWREISSSFFKKEIKAEMFILLKKFLKLTYSVCV